MTTTERATNPRRENALLALFRLRVFRRIWAAITFSSLGDWLGLLANTALAQQLTHQQSLQAQGAAISGVILVRLAPDILFGAFAAALADKLDRRKTVIIGDTLAGLLYASIALGYNLVWLYIAQFAIEAVGLFTQPAKQVVWVAIVPKQHLATANQLSLVSVYGTVPVASAVFALLSVINRLITGDETFTKGDVNGAIVLALLLNTISFFVSASTVFLSRREIPARPGAREREAGVFSLLREGVAFVRQQPLIRGLYVGIIGAFAAGGLTVGVAQLWVATLSAGAAGYSIMFGTVFTGLAVGMLVGPRALPSLARSRVFGLAIGGAGITLLGMSLVQDFVLADVLAALIGLFAGMAWIIGYTLIGHEVEDRLRGRIFSFVLSSVRLMLLATIAIGPNLAGLIGSHTLRVGRYAHLRFSGPGLTLLLGGLVALLVSWYATSRATPNRTRLRDIIRRRVVRAGAGGPSDHQGLFLTVDGVDPQATAVIAELLAAAVRERRLTMTVTGEPTDSPTGRRVREVLEGSQVEPETAALLSAADRSEHVAAVIRPALERSEVVICDRFVLSSVAVHGGSGADIDPNRDVNDWSTGGLVPDLGVVVDDPAAPGEARQALLDEADADPDRYLVCPAGAEALPAAVVQRLGRLVQARSSLIAAVPAAR
ncbi:MAG: bifunctional MFS transporter/dTMP kinase [Jatrophihabitans sp.]|uniref:bifunctional MFS transporter/dTMP kinase n=1 Tax=Jatrophihabitans sp. TaxID=1932789 RepID=UPI003F81A1C0